MNRSEKHNITSRQDHLRAVVVLTPTTPFLAPFCLDFLGLQSYFQEALAVSKSPRYGDIRWEDAVGDE
jgi:hypothetical protein